MRHLWIVAVLVGLGLAAPAWGQATSTPTLTPTQTPTITPFATPPRPAPNAALVGYVLLDTTQVATGTPLATQDYDALSVQVNAIGTCTAYDLALEGANTASPVYWAVVQAVDEAAVASGTSKIYALTAPIAYVRARTHTAVTNCRVQAILTAHTR